MSVFHRILTMFMALAAVACTSAPKGQDRGRELLETARNDYMTGEYIESMKSLHEYITAVEVGDIDPDPQTDMHIYKFLGNIHLVYQDVQGAIKNYEIALDREEVAPDGTERLKILYNLGLASCIMGDSVKTLGYVRQIGSVGNADPGLKRYFHTVASAYYESSFGDRASAAVKLKEALGIVKTAGLENYLKFTPYAELCSWYEEQGRYGDALKILAEFERELDRTPESPSSLMQCMQQYMSVYTKLGDREKATYYQTRFMHVSDSLMNHNRFAKAREGFSRSRAEDSSSRIVSLRSVLSVQHTGLFAGIVAMVGSVGLWIFRRMRQRKEEGDPVSFAQPMLSAPLMTPALAEPIASSGTETAVRTGAPDPRNSELYGKICSLIDDPDNFSNPDYSMERLATELDSNVKYVSRAVHECAGTNFRTFINDRRIARAREILENEGDGVPIADVCRRVGFASQSAFIAAFRRVTGTTPSKYQRALRKSD